MRKITLTATQLKLLSITVMALDHFAEVFIDHTGIWGMILRIPGRIVAPIMCYLIAEGFFHTSNKWKYLGRLLIFALISHVPYNLCMGSSFPTTSVMWSLAMGLTALIAVKKEGLHWIVKVIIVGICCVISRYANWNYVAVLWIVFFGIYRGNFKMQAVSFGAIGLFLHILPTFANWNFSTEHPPHWYQLFIFAAIPLLAMYNGQKGTNSKFISRFFYWFYPAHLLIIYLLGILTAA